MSTPTQELENQLLEWRRVQVIDYLAQGKRQSEIATILKVDPSTISRDYKFLRQEAKDKQAEYLENEIPFRHRLRVASMDKAIAELWALLEKETDNKGKKAILDSITDALIKQAAIDGDPIAIERAIRTVAKLRKTIQEQREQETVA